MAYTIEQIGARERMWDTARIQRSPTESEVARAACLQLSPTALLPAVWTFGWNGAAYPYVFRLAFSTDTALAWTMYDNLHQVNEAAAPTAALGNAGLTSSYKFGGAVIALPALGTSIDGGYASAGSYTDLLHGVIYVPRWDYGFVLATPAVIANCSLTIWWAEYND